MITDFTFTFGEFIILLFVIFTIAFCEIASGCSIGCSKKEDKRNKFEKFCIKFGTKLSDWLSSIIK